MSVLGLTIDYGPFGWMDYFDMNYICNHSDESGRYSYKNQPSICKWNLIKFAQALKSHLPYEKTEGYVNHEFDSIYKSAYYEKMREKVNCFLKKFIR